MEPPTKPQFFKPFLPGSERQLSIPDAFFKSLKGQNCDKAVLRNVNGKTWVVKIKGRKLQDGWEEFVRDHDLQVGNFLVFRHGGDMLFDVMVFDNSACERDYPSATSSQVNVKFENETVDLTSQVNLEVENETPNLEGTTDKYAANAGASVKKTKVMTNIQEKAKPSLLKSSYFEVIVTSSSMKKSVMTIPKKFVKQNCLRKARCEILLVNQQGRLWTARMKCGSGSTYIGSGWSSFRSENHLNCGDSFIFNLIAKGKKLVFKMHGLRKAKKEPNPAQKKLPFRDIKYASSSIRNPYFIAPINMCNGKQYGLVVPAQFARMNGLFRKRCDMILEDQRGKPWPMSLRPSVDRLLIGNGWFGFIKAKV